MRLRRALIGGALVVVAAGGILLATRSGESQSPLPPPIGAALEVGRPWTIEAPLQPGQEMIDLTTAVENISEDALEVVDLEIDPGEGIPGTGRVEALYLVEFPFDAALHNALPPVMRRRGRCVTAELEPVGGYLLEPGEIVMIGVHIRARDVGRFSAGPRTIFYEQGGRTYRQDDEYFFSGEVRPTWKRELSGAERACRSETRILPGA